MTAKSLVCAALVALALTEPTAAQQTPVFSASVEAVEVDVFVTSNDRPVGDLRAEDFEVQDNGVRQDVRLVELEKVGTTATLVVDASDSVQGRKLDELKEGARLFTQALGERDEAGLLTFSHAVRWQQRATADRSALLRAIDGISPAGATSMFDALYAALSRSWGKGRPLVVLYTDGRDTASWLGAEAVQEAARRSSATVEIVASEPEGRDALVRKLNRSELFKTGVAISGASLDEPPHFSPLRKIAALTGGRFSIVSSASPLRQRFLEVLETLKARYVLAYEPKGTPRKGWHQLKVRVKGRKVDVRHRLEYVVSGAATR